ncbi:MAG: hypothetical protein IKP22_05535 [Clostridia bacterium]|nr:hypothetical protein [Clostridia bacterium]
MQDIESIVKDLVAKFTGDSALLESFKKDPVKTIKEKLGINISDDQIQAVISAVTAKLGLENAGGLLNKIKGLFGK